MRLANRLELPDSIAAILWDLDGVLLDTLTADFTLCNAILERRYGPGVSISNDRVRELFPFDLSTFWRMMLEPLGVEVSAAPALAEEHATLRHGMAFAPNPGIVAILQDVKRLGLKQAVVSNNPTAEVRTLIEHGGLLKYFDAITGNDLEAIQKKPAPDPYLLGARLLGVAPAKCAAIEDSLLGLASGHAAGCFTVGVATGAARFEALETSKLAKCVYEAFNEPRFDLAPGNVAVKHLHSPNDFVSHMVEHIAWRLGCSLHMDWWNNDWHALGVTLGNAIAKFPGTGDRANVLGMIDDGSAEVTLTREASHVAFRGAVDIDWFLGLRCEQMANGTSLVKLLEGLAKSLALSIDVTVCSVEDPHHTWEGVFRSVGIGLSELFAISAVPPAKPITFAGWTVEASSIAGATVSRATAESIVRLAIDLTQSPGASCRFAVAPSISLNGLSPLLDSLANAAGVKLDVLFEATRLNSSHVACEDTGMVLGRAVRELFEARMTTLGANGAGFSGEGPIRVGVSIEGRKFWKFVPFAEEYDTFRKRFLIGHSVGDLFTEDLDDLLDGLAGGMGCSIIVHVKDAIAPDAGWPLLFRALGEALAMALAENPHRRGLPPGVKATLA